mmetsp:Transcript_12989/g.28199  ORF Transcript_12989/g.28199 Transcript_12989/m.28199 type:complete len:304 (+) Transcript_12989:3931-4842(+)
MVTRSLVLSVAQAFANLLRRRSASLVELDLSGNLISDQAAAALASGLAGNSSLRNLNLRSNSQIRTAGWTAFAVFIQESVLEVLDLSLNRIDVDAAVALGNALRNLQTLRSLDLSGNHQVSSGGWTRAVSPILRNPNSSLEVMKIVNSGVGDDAAVSFAAALANNNTMKVLDLDCNTISEVGWDAFTQLVCDGSSLMRTHSSNHTLGYLCTSLIDISEFHTGLVRSLHLNRSDNKCDVARKKILKCHFQANDMNLQEIVGMELNVMPSAINWIGRDGMGHSLMFQLARTMPSMLFDHGNKQGN